MSNLWKHQIEAIQAMEANGSGIVSCATGTGKTVIFTTYLARNRGCFNIIVFPRLSLIDQYIENYINFFNPNTTLIANASSEGISTEDVKDIVSKSLPGLSTLILTTYNTFNKLIDSFSMLDVTINSIIFDEAHRLTPNISSFIALNIFYFTATPTAYLLEQSKTIFCYSFKHALADGICKDFEIVLNLIAKENNPTNLMEAIRDIMNETGCYKAISFHSSVEPKANSSRISVREMSQVSVLDVNTFSLTSSDKSKKRSKILSDFANTPYDKKSILFNCNIVSEGIDIKSANMCVFTSEKESVVNIIQNVGRITRADNMSTQKGVVYIPVFVTEEEMHLKEEELVEDIITRKGYSRIINALIDLKNNNTVIIQETEDIQYIDIYR